MRIGPYTIVGEVGRGGMGVVYRAKAPDGRAVAVKRLGGHYTQRAIVRFDRERRLLSRFSERDGFVALLDAGMSDLGPYIVMPFVGGGTLASRMQGGPMPVEAVVELARRLAAALARAHDQGVVHRDLKPENVLYGDDGAPLVADLGLAKHFRQTTNTWTEALSRTGAFQGTFGYMAPEQARDAKTVGPAADVWSLGAILHECLTGTPLLNTQNPVEYLVQAASLRAPSVRERRHDVPPWLDRVVLRALAPDPRKRWANGRELLRALEDGETENDRPAGRLAGALAVGGAVGLVVAALAVWLFAVDRDRGVRALPRRRPRPEVTTRPVAPRPIEGERVDELAPPSPVAPAPTPPRLAARTEHALYASVERTARTRLRAI